jgi:hypothetical protein
MPLPLGGRAKTIGPTKEASKPAGLFQRIFRGRGSPPRAAFSQGPSAASSSSEFPAAPAAAGGGSGDGGGPLIGPKLPHGGFYSEPIGPRGEHGGFSMAQERALKGWATRRAKPKPKPKKRAAKKRKTSKKGRKAMARRKAKYRFVTGTLRPARRKGPRRVRVRLNPRRRSNPSMPERVNAGIQAVIGGAAGLAVCYGVQAVAGKLATPTQRGMALLAGSVIGGAIVGGFAGVGAGAFTAGTLGVGALSQLALSSPVKGLLAGPAAPPQLAYGNIGALPTTAPAVVVSAPAPAPAPHVAVVVNQAEKEIATILRAVG